MPALHGVRCIGEVTDLHQNSTALCFTITDGDAKLPCMIWSNHYRNMDADLEDGTEVIPEGYIDYWTGGGKIDLKPWRRSAAATGTKQPPSNDRKANLKSVAGSTTSRNSVRRRSQSGLGPSLLSEERPATTSRARFTSRTRLSRYL